MDAREIGMRAKRFRELRRVSQSAVADKIGVGVATIGRFERGNLQSGDVMRALWNEGLSLDWMMSGEGPMLRSERAGAASDPRLADPDAVTAAIIATVREVYKLSPAARSAEVIRSLFMSHLDKTATASMEIDIEDALQDIAQRASR